MPGLLFEESVGVVANLALNLSASLRPEISSQLVLLDYEDPQRPWMQCGRPGSRPGGQSARPRSVVPFQPVRSGHPRNRQGVARRGRLPRSATSLKTPVENRCDTGNCPAARHAYTG